MGRAQFCKWEMEKKKKKKDSKQEKQGGNEAVGSSWKPVGQVSDFHCASDCCTCPSITVKCSLSCHWNHSGSSPRVNSLPIRKKRQKQPWGDREGSRSLSESLTDQKRHPLSLTWLQLRGRWESSREMSCPAHFWDQRSQIWNRLCLVKGPSFHSRRASRSGFVPLPHFKHNQTHSQTFFHLLSSWEKFPIVQLDLAVFLSPWKELGKAETMHSLLMRWDNLGSREISTKCHSCIWHW